jgi:hypothetical protein
MKRMSKYLQQDEDLAIGEWSTYYFFEKHFNNINSLEITSNEMRQFFSTIWSEKLKNWGWKMLKAWSIEMFSKTEKS